MKRRRSRERKSEEESGVELGRRCFSNVVTLRVLGDHLVLLMHEARAQGWQAQTKGRPQYGACFLP